MDESVVDNGANESVLLVEDDAATRGLLSRYLRTRGYAVTSVESAEDVVVKARDRHAPFDVVISDVHLPGMSGIDLASFLLMQRPTQAIVLVTGDPDEALAREALSRGPVNYLLKPFELVELETALRQALDRMRDTSPPAGYKQQNTDSSLRDRQQSSSGVGTTADTAAEPTGGFPELADGKIPDEWLEYVDQRSYAGPGHAERVARIATVLLSALPDVEEEISAEDLALAARTHEIGRLEGPAADPAQTAAHGAELLEEANFPEIVISTVRHLHERWDGSGGPDGLAHSQIPPGATVLAAADSLDHYCSAWMQAGMKPADAVDRAIGLVVVQQSTVFSPIVAGAVHRERAAIRAVCTSQRDEVSAGPDGIHDWDESEDPPTLSIA